MALTATHYQRAVALLESVEARGMKPGLERTVALLQELGNPHTGLRGALVAGTNGKGSACATIDSIVRAAGLRSVMLTKPHLRSYCERIAIDGEAITEEALCEVIETVYSAAASLPDDVQPTAFEMLTAAGLLVAGRHSPDVVICEVGLGGRLDSTNVVDLGVAVVTNVGLDHCDRLGDTVSAIAREKAAIIKPGNRAVTGAESPALEVIRERAREVNATLNEVSRVSGRGNGLSGVELTAPFHGRPLQVTSPLVGDFQIRNVATAVAACDVLREDGFAIDADDVARGTAGVRWQGRMQWFALRPAVLVDGAHNPPGIAALIDAARSLLGGRRVVALFAAMRDKDVRAMVNELGRLQPTATVVTAPDVARSTPPDELATLIGESAVVMPDTRRGLERARYLAGRDGAVVVCGSLYLAGEVLEILDPAG